MEKKTNKNMNLTMWNLTIKQTLNIKNNEEVIVDTTGPHQ